MRDSLHEQGERHALKINPARGGEFSAISAAARQRPCRSQASHDPCGRRCGTGVLEPRFPARRWCRTSPSCAAIDWSTSPIDTGRDAETACRASTRTPSAAGPAAPWCAARPPRVKVLSDGSALMDASEVSPDHAVSGEPLLLLGVEILRGPSALLVWRRRHRRRGQS